MLRKFADIGPRVGELFLFFSIAFHKYSGPNESLDNLGRETWGQEDASSCHTVCKEYVMPASNEPVNTVPDFVTFCRFKGFNHIVRANYSNEHGLEEFGGSYDIEDLIKCEIQHLECPTLDKDGVGTAKGVPWQGQDECYTTL